MLKNAGSATQGGSLVKSVQALRALAVSVVVLNHYFPSRLTGGFIGVDIFFVVSGFLITGKIIADIEVDHFSFTRFYSGRARRLLPAALLVLAFSLLLTLIWLPVTTQASSLRDVATASLYALNWRLILTDTHYFADHTEASIVLHYWSLSVEEQFYLIWPLIVVVTALVAGRRNRPSHRRKAFIATAAVITFISFAWAITVGLKMEDGNYFDLRARAWEFGLGAMTSQVATRGSYFPLFASLLSILGWGGIVFSSFWLTPQSQVPGWAAVVPCLATCAVIWAGDYLKPKLLWRLISSSVVQRLGDVSYSLYLWHWPLLVAAPYVLGLPSLSAFMRLLLVGVSVAAAFITKAGVEDPIRLHAPIPLRSHSRGLASLVFLSCILAFTATAFSNQRLKMGANAAEKLYRLSLNPDKCFGGNAAISGENCGNLHELDDPHYLFQAWSNQINLVPNGTTCQNERLDERVHPCSFGTKEGKERARVALFGDSHAGMWAAGIAMFAEQKSLRIDMYTASACPPTSSDDVFAVHMPVGERASCAQWRREAIDRIASDAKIKYVVTSGNLFVHQRLGADGNWLADDGSGYVNVWNKFLDAGKKIIVIDDIPSLPIYFANCVALSHGLIKKCEFDQPVEDEPNAYAKAVAKINKKALMLVGLNDILCYSKRCSPVVGGIPAYLDREHISAPFARSVASILLDAIVQIGE
ncbi:acyltransferase family protein [Bradyrhizobium sp. BR13661]|uniref:acyltransferase family protein n=2 Tax=Pseudomonadota TaxID=1224 RepID=UPI0024765F35|nr:acyltransferase family protein [Bradyrhizobium sp. BR13661]MDH6264365.1 peptidoglycan/LPS O-acetylase OafA/YrhL [Bradyrhizobium sp. BR13661]